MIIRHFAKTRPHGCRHVWQTLLLLAIGWRVAWPIEKLVMRGEYRVGRWRFLFSKQTQRSDKYHTRTAPPEGIRAARSPLSNILKYSHNSLVGLVPYVCLYAFILYVRKCIYVLKKIFFLPCRGREPLRYTQISCYKTLSPMRHRRAYCQCRQPWHQQRHQAL